MSQSLYEAAMKGVVRFLPDKCVDVCSSFQLMATQPTVNEVYSVIKSYTDEQYNDLNIKTIG